MRIVTRDQDVMRLATEAILDPLGRVVRLEVARRGERREGVANAPERLGCLPRAKLSTVPHHYRTRAARCRVGGEALNFCAPSFGQRPARIDIRSDRVAMMNEIEVQLSTLKSEVSTLGTLRVGLRLDR